MEVQTPAVTTMRTTANTAGPYCSQMPPSASGSSGSSDSRDVGVLGSSFGSQFLMAQGFSSDMKNAFVVTGLIVRP